MNFSFNKTETVIDFEEINDIGNLNDFLLLNLDFAFTIEKNMKDWHKRRFEI